jgi:capsular exopolysaccharide synthesis family protein
MASSEEEVSLLQWLIAAREALRRHPWIAVALPLLGVCVAATTTSYITPLYAGRASVCVEVTPQHIVNDVEVGWYALSREMMQAQRVLATSTPVLKRAVEFARATGKPPPADLLAYLAGSEATVEGQLISLRGIHPDPAWAAELANCWVKAFVEENTKRERAGSVYTRQFLDEQLPARREEWLKKQEALQKFQIETRFDPQELPNHPAVKRYLELEQKTRALELTELDLSSELKLWKQSGGNMAALLQTPRARADKRVTDLVAMIEAQQLKIAHEGQLYAEKSPSLEKAKGELKLIEDSARRLLDTTRDQLDADFRLVQSQLADLRPLKGDAEKEYQQIKSLEARYKLLLFEAERAKSQYEELFQRQQQADVAGRVTYSSVQPWERAEVPGRPFYPNWPMNLLVGFVVGTLLSFGVIALREMADTSVKSPVDLRRHLGVSVLGTFPLLDRKDLPGSGYFLARDRPELGVLEQLKLVRNSLSVSLEGSSESGGISILVTSARDREGKTLVASNLAILFAKAGRRVLLVDLDMHKASLSQAWECTQGPGLHQLLSGARLAEMTRPLSVPNLEFLSAHGIDGAGPIAESPLLVQALEAARQSYQVVVLDTPPLLLADASTVVSKCDATLMVTRSRYTETGQLARAVEILERAHARNVFFLVNAMTRRDMEGAEYGYGYGYKHGYGYGYGYGYGHGRGGKAGAPSAGEEDEN